MRNWRLVSFILVPLSVICVLIFKHHTFVGSSQCSFGYFRLPGMTSCHPWLTCLELESIAVKELIGLGAVKAVYKATWKEFFLAYSKLSNPHYLNDFKYGLHMLKLFQPSPFVVQLVGFCEVDNVILTEYHKNGNAVNITQISVRNLKFRLKLCLNYALLLEYLHNSPFGTRVMCDSNDLAKLLSQLLVTDNHTLILNDLDALPEVDRRLNLGVKCGHQQLTGTFVAPEQLWPFSSPFSDNKMPGYNEKTDIWKAASVCEYFLGDVPNSDMARYHLFSLHKSCKNTNPERRPTANQLVKGYMKAMEELDSNL
jgi:glycoprotein-mannosyl O6-kinase